MFKFIVEDDYLVCLLEEVPVKKFSIKQIADIKATAIYGLDVECEILDEIKQHLKEKYDWDLTTEQRFELTKAITEYSMGTRNEKRTTNRWYRSLLRN